MGQARRTIRPDGEMRGSCVHNVCETKHDCARALHERPWAGAHPSPGARLKRHQGRLQRTIHVRRGRTGSDQAAACPRPFGSTEADDAPSARPASRKPLALRAGVSAGAVQRTRLRRRGGCPPRSPPDQSTRDRGDASAKGLPAPSDARPFQRTWIQCVLHSYVVIFGFNPKPTRRKLKFSFAAGRIRITRFSLWLTSNWLWLRRTGFMTFLSLMVKCWHAAKNGGRRR